MQYIWRFGSVLRGAGGSPHRSEQARMTVSVVDTAQKSELGRSWVAKRLADACQLWTGLKSESVSQLISKYCWDCMKLDLKACIN